MAAIIPPQLYGRMTKWAIRGPQLFDRGRRPAKSDSPPPVFVASVTRIPVAKPPHREPSEPECTAIPSRTQRHRVNDGATGPINNAPSVAQGTAQRFLVTRARKGSSRVVPTEGACAFPGCNTAPRGEAPMGVQP